jgi:hypothetical protein
VVRRCEGFGVCEDVATMMASSKRSASMLRPRGRPLQRQGTYLTGTYTREARHFPNMTIVVFKNPPARPSGFLRAESTFPRDCTLLLRNLGGGLGANLLFSKLLTDHHGLAAELSVTCTVVVYRSQGSFANHELARGSERGCRSVCR